MNPGQHLAIEEHTMCLTQHLVYIGHTSLQQRSLLGGKDSKGTASEQTYEPEMGPVQEYVRDTALCLVTGGGGIFWTDGCLSLFILVNIPKVHSLELVTSSTTLQIAQTQLNSHS